MSAIDWSTGSVQYLSERKNERTSLPRSTDTSSTKPFPISIRRLFFSLPFIADVSSRSTSSMASPTFAHPLPISVRQQIRSSRVQPTHPTATRFQRERIVTVLLVEYHPFGISLHSSGRLHQERLPEHVVDIQQRVCAARNRSDESLGRLSGQGRSTTGRTASLHSLLAGSV